MLLYLFGLCIDLAAAAIIAQNGLQWPPRMDARTELIRRCLVRQREVRRSDRCTIIAFTPSIAVLRKVGPIMQVSYDRQHPENCVFMAAIVKHPRRFVPRYLRTCLYASRRGAPEELHETLRPKRARGMPRCPEALAARVQENGRTHTR